MKKIIVEISPAQRCSLGNETSIKMKSFQNSQMRLHQKFCLHPTETQLSNSNFVSNGQQKTPICLKKSKI
jgi:hypothetical protein